MTTITAIFTGVAAHIAKYADAVVVSSGGGTQILVSGTPGLREDGTPPEEFTEVRQRAGPTSKTRSPRPELALAMNNAVSRLAALMSIGSIGLISVGTASATGFAPRDRGQRPTIRPGRVLRCAVDNQSSYRVPTCALRHRGVVPRSARCAARCGQQPSAATEPPPPQ